MMREAQKMMNDPAFQAQMKKITESSAFKQHMETQQEMLKDPKKVKELERKVQEKLTEGNKLLEKTNSERVPQEGVSGDQKENAKNVDEAEGEGEEKRTPKKEQEDDNMPDIPSLNLH
jgi:hypothetical protein